MKELRYIFSQKLAGLLMLKGFVLKEMRPDKYHKNRNVFIFNDSDELRSVLDDFNREEVLNEYNIKNSRNNNNNRDDRIL